MFVLRLLILGISLAFPAIEAHAHSSRAAPGYNASGIAIPSLAHGELKVLRSYYGEILDLAARVKASDPTFRKLENYTRIQNYYCFWGFAPRAVADEESPFNECSHAYLSAAKMLLMHMRDMPGTSPDAGALVSTIDAQMVQQGLAFIGCQYSGESFYTGDFVTPHWENMPAHMPTLAMASFPFIALAGFAVIRRRTVE